MPISGVLPSSQNVLHINGIPMTDELITRFTERAVSTEGFLRDVNLYETLMTEIVLPANRYHWLNEELSRRVSLYRMIVGYLFQQCDVREKLTDEFTMHLDFLRPSGCLNHYAAYQKQLILYYPSVYRGQAIFDELEEDKAQYDRLFPNTSFQEMSQLLRETSWVHPENWGAP